MRLHARLSAYRYDGPHRNWNPRTKRIERDFQHWCWRYVITFDGMTIYRRQEFHTWAAAAKSLAYNYPRIQRILEGESNEH